MKGRQAVLATRGPLRIAAMLSDGRLNGLEIDRLDDPAPRVGALLMARVAEVMPGIGAAFVDMGAAGTGFLPDAGDAKPGARLLVQVRRTAEATKAMRVSTDLQIAGRGVVFTPGAPGINISKRIRDARARDRLTDMFSPLASAGGFVLRTSAASLGTDLLLSEAEGCVAQYRNACEAATPGLCINGPDAFTRLIHGLSEVSVPMVADERSASEFRFSPPELRVSPAPLEDADVDAALDALLSSREPLREGDLLIEPTSTLVAVDINTGAARGAEAALRVNLAAATALPRALSLRKLGGVVMVDFAAGPKGAAREKIERSLRKAWGGWLEHPRLLGWGPAGLLEMRCARPGCSLADLLEGVER